VPLQAMRADLECLGAAPKVPTRGSAVCSVTRVFDVCVGTILNVREQVFLCRFLGYRWGIECFLLLSPVPRGWEHVDSGTAICGAVFVAVSPILKL
jgi:hypothetical protein